MKKVYKNQIFHLLRNHNLGFDNFLFEPDEDLDMQITYKPFDEIFKYVFVQDADSLDYFVPYGVNYDPKMRLQSRSDPQNPMLFEEILKDFNYWLNDDIASYIDDESEIDLWEEYKKNTLSVDLSKINFQDQSNFNQDEKQQILLGIKELKLLMLRDYANDEIEERIINERLDYLIQATDRTGNKTDWKNIYINTFITICIALSLDTQRGNELYQLFLNVLHTILSLNK